MERRQVGNITWLSADLVWLDYEDDIKMPVDFIPFLVFFLYICSYFPEQKVYTYKIMFRTFLFVHHKILYIYKMRPCDKICALNLLFYIFVALSQYKIIFVQNS